MANFYLSSFAYGQMTPWGGQQNLLLRSNTFNNATWTATNSSATQGSDPDPFGGTLAWRFIDNVTNGQHALVQSVTKTGAAKRYMFSCYAKVGPTLTRLKMILADSTTVGGTNGASVTFDLTGGQIGVAAALIGAGFTLGIYKIEPVLGQTGWYRCELSVVTNTALVISPQLETDSGTGTGAASASYAGSSNYVLIYGAQLEPALYVCGAYTATTTAAVTQTVSFSATLGMLRRPTDPGADGFGTTNTIGLNAERAYRCTTAGTAGSVEPSASNSNPFCSQTGGTVTDNAAVWTEITGNETWQVAGSWAPYARLFAFGNASNIRAATISSFPAGGASYAVNDIFMITGVTTPWDYPICKVTSVTGGAVTGATILDGGVFASGTTALATTKVTGSGNNAMTITITTANHFQEVAGDSIYVGNRHNEWNTAAVSVTLPGTTPSPNLITSVDESASGAVPPTASNLLAGAQIGTVAGNNITLSGALEANGLTIRAGTVGSLATFTLSSGVARLYGCAIWLGGSAGGNFSIAVGESVFLENTTLKVSATGSSIAISDNFVWRNTASALQGAVFANVLLTPANNFPGYVIVEGVDLSALGSGKTLVGSNSFGPVQIIRCKLGSSLTINSQGSSITANPIDVIQCDSGALVTRNERYWTQATLTTDTAVTRTGGAVDGATAVSWKTATTANNNRAWPFETFKMSIWNATTGSGVNVNVFGVCNQATPNTGDLWLDVDYLGTVGSTLGSISTQQPVNALSATPALTADTSAWDANVTLRANTTAYVAGNVIKSANNVGRIFICTAPGTSAGSEPGGYGTAVDGGTVTDGGATFIAGFRFKQTINVTPQIAGYIHATIKIAKASTTALYWVDGKPTLS